MATSRDVSDEEAQFIKTVLSCTTNTPQVDWDLVSSRAAYSKASTAKAKFAQIKKALGISQERTIAPRPSSAKASTKNGKTPAKVTKVRGIRKVKAAAKAKAEPKSKNPAVGAKDANEKESKKDVDKLGKGDSDDDIVMADA